MPGKSSATTSAPEGTKWCPACKTFLPYGNFNIWVKRKDGLSPYCSPCYRKYRTAWDEDHHGRAKERYGDLRREVLAAYGNKCVACGESEPVVLEIDHIDPKLKEIELANGWRPSGLDSMRRIKGTGFPSDFQILCRNCNWKKRWGKLPGF